MLVSRRWFGQEVTARRSGSGRRTEAGRCIALATFSLGLVTRAANAFVPSPDQDALEIPLPFQQGNLVYGDAVAALAIPPVGASIETQIGGQWSVHSWNRQSGSPHYILGSGADVAPALANGSDAESAAHLVLGQLAPALNLDTDQLRVDEVTDGARKYSVHFQQTYEGLDVLGGRAHATFLNTGRVFAMGADFYRIGDVSITPGISRAEAEKMAIDDLPHQERAVSSEVGEETGLYVLPYPTSLESFEPRLVWKVTVVTDGRSGVFHTYLDAHTGEIMWRQNGVHYTDYVGTTEGGVEHTTYCNGEATQRMKYMEVSVEDGVGTTISDANGDWRVPNDDNITRAVSMRFYGPFVDVNRASGGEDPFWSAFATPGIPETLSWTDDNSRQDERDVFDSVVDIHDFFAFIDPAFSFPNTRVTANVGVTGTCNAFWNGSSINFYNAGGGCANTGEIQSVVHHEYGHGVQDHLVGGSGNEGIHEGNADILANFMTDEAIIGRGFNLNNCSGGIRTSDNNRQYPENLNGQVHNDGQIIAGVMWDVRQNLQTSLGGTNGELQAAILWHWGRRLERPTNQPDQCLSMFIADDDNGNVFDGTPNFDAICQAVLAHDTDGDAFDCPEAGSVWVDAANSGSENGTQEHPYNSIFQAQSAAPIGYIMKTRSGAYVEVGTLSKRGTIRAIGGVVRVGAP